MRFEQFYVHSLCAPTRASTLTGRHFWRTGVCRVHGGRQSAFGPFALGRGRAVLTLKAVDIAPEVFGGMTRIR